MNNANDNTGSLTARNAAVKMLLAVCAEKKFSGDVKEEVLPKISDPRERALANRLLDGCLERLTEIDYILDSFSKTPMQKCKPVIAAILRVTVYQLRFMDRIPASAACNEAVNLAKKYGFAGLSGFVNGVTRSIARAEEIPYPDSKKNRKRAWSVIYSMPSTIIELLLSQYGPSQTEEICSAFLRQNESLSVRCMTGSIHVEELKRKLTEAGFTVEDGKYSKDALLISDAQQVTALPGFLEGWFYVQDESSMQAVLAAGLTGKEKVLDLCSAPGGKTVAAADLIRNGGSVDARDVSESKVFKIRENIKRLKLNNVTAKVSDGTVFHKEDEKAFDVVLADVPCSGLGILRKKPDIKYFYDKENQKELRELQKAILKNAASYVKPGGVLIFSTCTIDKEENMAGFEFLKNECRLVPESLDGYLSPKLLSETTKEGWLQMLPHKEDADGFFIARFRRECEKKTDI